MAANTDEVADKPTCGTCKGHDFSFPIAAIHVWQKLIPGATTIQVDPEGQAMMCKTPACTRNAVNSVVSRFPGTKEGGPWYFAILVCHNADVCDVPNPDAIAAEGMPIRAKA